MNIKWRNVFVVILLFLALAYNRDIYEQVIQPLEIGVMWQDLCSGLRQVPALRFLFVGLVLVAALRLMLGGNQRPTR